MTVQQTIEALSKLRPDVQVGIYNPVVDETIYLAEIVSTSDDLVELLFSETTQGGDKFAPL